MITFAVLSLMRENTHIDVIKLILISSVEVNTNFDDMLENTEQNTNLILSRLKSVFKVKTDADLARELEIPKSTVSNWKIRNKFNWPLVVTVCKKKNVSLEWLLDLHHSETVLEVKEKDEHPKTTRSKSLNKQEYLPLLTEDTLRILDEMEGTPQEKMQSYLDYLDDHDLKALYKVPSFKKRGGEWMYEVLNACMEPRYSCGDVLGLREIKDMAYFEWGKVYTIYTTHGSMVRRIYKVETDNSIIECRADNDKFPVITIPKSSIKHMYIVIGAIHLE